MSSEKKKRVPVKKAKLKSRCAVSKSANSRFVAQKASSLLDTLLFKVTGAPVGDHVLMMHNIRQGLSFESIETLAEAFGSPRKEIARVLSIPVSTLNRRRKEGRLLTDESDRVARLARLRDFAVEMMNGDNDAAIQWLKAPSPILGGESPLEHASTEMGAREVEDLMGRIQHGVSS